MSERENCFYHEDRPATAVGYCAFCGSAVCDECHTGPYCNFCIKEPPKLQGMALLFAVLLGWLGVHRYYMGFYFTGVIYTLTFGLFGIGWAIDVIRILFWSTVKKPKGSAPVVIAVASEMIQESMSQDTKDFLQFRFWRDKYNRPLLPFGRKSLV